LKKEALKFLLNGLISTLIHYVILVVAIEILGVVSIVLANMMAGATAVLYSFVGNKYYVFKSHDEVLYFQAFKFLIVYTLLIILHTIAMFVLTNKMSVSYHISFIMVSSLFAMASFFLNKIVVFRR
jgi:putative flippase GtrA